jgi:two-component system, NarL family, response regulator DegU
MLIEKSHLVGLVFEGDRSTGTISRISAAFLHTLRMFLEGDPTFKIVATARSGRDVISAVELWHPKVVLMDLQMPGMNGLEATEKLHQDFPEIPVIILTAHDLPIACEACMKHGAYGFVPKSQLGDELPALLVKATLHCRK